MDLFPEEIGRFTAASEESTRKAALAYERLLHKAETRDSGQITRVVRFLAATYNGRLYPFDLFELRAVDVAISDDMLACLDALRWGQSDLYKLVPNGDARMLAVLGRWGLRPKEVVA